MSRNSSSIKQLNEERYTTHGLSSYQKEFYWEQKLNPNLSHYIGFHLRIEGPLEVPILKQSLLQLAVEHDVLRFEIHEDLSNGQPYFRCYHDFTDSIQYKDFSSEENAESSLLDYLNWLDRKPIAFLKGPLFQSGIFKVHNQLHYLYGKIHHIIADGKSIETTLDFIFNYYNKSLANV